MGVPGFLPGRSPPLPLRADSCVFPARAPLGKTGYGAKPHHYAYSAGVVTRGCGIRCEDLFPGFASHSSFTHLCKHVSTRLDVMQVCNLLSSALYSTDWILMKVILFPCPECGSTALTLSVSSIYTRDGSSLDGHVFCGTCHNGVWCEGVLGETMLDVLMRVSSAWNTESFTSGCVNGRAVIEVLPHA